MLSNSPSAPVSKGALWTGRVFSTLIVLMLLMSAYFKFNLPPDAKESMFRIGWNENLLPTLGILEIVCTIIYLIPQTAVLGAILLTGYLGGAIATHVRVGEPVIVPAALGVVVWLGLYLRDTRLRALIPLRSV